VTLVSAIGLALALGLIVYLAVALLYPETLE